MKGLIHCTDLCSISEKTSSTSWPLRGVIEVQRLRSRHDSPNPRIRLRFQSLGLPQRLYCGYLSVAVAPWVSSHRQCRKHWRFGHVERTCRSSAHTCGMSVPHPTEGCDAPALRLVRRCPPGVGPQLPGMDGSQGGPDGHGPPSPGQDPISPAVASPVAQAEPMARPRVAVPPPGTGTPHPVSPCAPGPVGLGPLKPPRCHLVQGRARRTLRGQ